MHRGLKTDSMLFESLVLKVVQGLRIRKDYCANDDIQSVEDNGVRTSAEVLTYRYPTKNHTVKPF